MKVPGRRRVLLIKPQKSGKPARSHQFFVSGQQTTRKGRLLPPPGPGPEAPEDVHAGVVAAAARANDPLARLLVDEVPRALVTGTVGLVNAFNPCRLILGGGVMQGLPELLDRIDTGIRRLALNAASEGLEVLPAQPHNDAGVVGAGHPGHPVLRGVK